MQALLDESAPLLRSLVLPRSILLAPFYSFPEGIPSFLHFRLRVIVHEVMRVVTSDFADTRSLPNLPSEIRSQILDWVAIIMWHLVRFFVRLYDHVPCF